MAHKTRIMYIENKGGQIDLIGGAQHHRQRV
jgi:hypothetical protein